MALLDKEKNFFSTDEAKQRLYQNLTEYTGWKFIKSQSCLRKREGDFVFDIQFYFSKYNNLEDVVDVQCEFRIWSLALDRNMNVNSVIGVYSMKPKKGSWYDISTQAELDQTVTTIKQKIDQYVFPVVKKKKKSVTEGMNYIGSITRRKTYCTNSLEAFKKLKKDLQVNS